MKLPETDSTGAEVMEERFGEPQAWDLQGNCEYRVKCQPKKTPNQKALLLGQCGHLPPLAFETCWHGPAGL